MLENDRVACEYGGKNDIDRREQWVIPRGQVEHDAERVFDDSPIEAVLPRKHDVAQAPFGNRDHMPRARRHPCNFVAGLDEGFAHHSRDVGGDRFSSRLHFRDGALAKRGSIRDRRPSEVALSYARPVEG
jgi:hypothetical protein